jgi:diguanylate cyclase (GGDEF)-like protein
VDDQDANVQLLENMLRETGYLHITTTTDPHDVYKLHHDNHYDLILLDLEMPGMSGFEVMQELNKNSNQSRVPILVITAHHGQSVSSLDAGAKDFIRKPFDLRETKTRIHNLLESHLRFKELEAYSREQETLALHDELTGLPNRRLLEERMHLAIAHVRRNNFSMGVLYLDLDGFKLVNDTYGHDAGDALLTMVAMRLRESVREEDTVARLCGDEFVILLLDLNLDNNVNKLVNKLIGILSEPYSIKGHDIHITASIGVSIYPANGDKVEMLMESADMAMYKAKRAGKNSFCIAASNVIPAAG